MRQGRDAPLPLEINLFSTDRTYQCQMSDWFERTRALSAWIQPLVARALAEDYKTHDRSWLSHDNAKLEFERLKRAYRQWSRDIIATMAQGTEIRSYVSNSNTGERTYYTMHMHAWVELSRVHWLLQHPTLHAQRSNVHQFGVENISADRYDVLWSLSNTEHPMWIQVRESFIMTKDRKAEDERDEGEEGKEEKEKEEADLETDELALESVRQLRQMWECPILEYSQSQVRALLMFITQQMSYIPSADKRAMGEFTRVHRLLWVRATELIMQLQRGNVMDEPELRMATPQQDVFACNRLWLAFCTIYSVQVERRIFLHTIVGTSEGNFLRAPDNLASLRRSVHAWCAKALEQMPDESVATALERATHEGYAFGGDDAWFRFQWPTRMNTRGAVVTALRPHLYRRFYSEELVPRDVLMRNANREPASRIFMLNVMDEMVRTIVPNVQWLNGVVVSADGFEDSKWKLENPMGPMLLQTISSFWAHDMGQVYVTDDIYESLAMWFWLLQDRYRGYLNGTDLSTVIDKAFETAGDAEVDANTTSRAEQHDFHF